MRKLWRWFWDDFTLYVVLACMALIFILFGVSLVYMILLGIRDLIGGM